MSNTIVDFFHIFMHLINNIESNKTSAFKSLGGKKAAECILSDTNFTKESVKKHAAPVSG